MKCAENEIKISQYIDKVLPEGEMAEVTRHLNECASCRDTLRALEGVNKLFSAVDPIAVSEDFDSGFEAKLSRALEREQAPNILDEILERLRGLGEAVLSPRVPVLVKSAVTFSVAVFAVISGLCFTEMEKPVISGVTGTGYIMKAGRNDWVRISEGAVLRKGDMLRSDVASEINVALRSRYYLRLKDDSVIKVASLSPRRRHGVSSFVLKKGDILVDIEKGFKGSTFKVDTQAAEVKALGTKFMVSSDEVENNTWVGVLEGKVKVYGKDLGGVSEDIIVPAGMKAEILPGKSLSRALPLLMEEWKQLSEIYMLGKKTRVALLIGIGKNRVLDLLRPCPIFIADEKPRVIPRGLEDAIYLIYQGDTNNDRGLCFRGIKKLVDVVKSDPEAEYNTQLKLYIGSLYYYIDMNIDAVGVFRSIYTDEPHGVLASLAMCAEAVIYKKGLGKKDKADDLFRSIIKKYSASPEAEFSRDSYDQ